MAFSILALIDNQNADIDTEFELWDAHGRANDDLHERYYGPVDKNESMGYIVWEVQQVVKRCDRAGAATYVTAVAILNNLRGYRLYADQEAIDVATCIEEIVGAA